MYQSVCRLRCISYYSYIKPQLFAICAMMTMSCISYYSYIKPQRIENIHPAREVVYRTIPTSNHNMRVLSRQFNQLYIVLFLHQTTTVTLAPSSSFGCISYYSYIKPQPNGWCSAVHGVVYRTIPTSNHNTSACVLPMRFVVYRTIPTSNHNLVCFCLFPAQLYIVLFLHQTTTYNVDIADNQHITITFINKK